MIYIILNSYYYNCLTKIISPRNIFTSPHVFYFDLLLKKIVFIFYKTASFSCKQNKCKCFRIRKRGKNVFSNRKKMQHIVNWLNPPLNTPMSPPIFQN